MGEIYVFDINIMNILFPRLMLEVGKLVQNKNLSEFYKY